MITTDRAGTVDYVNPVAEKMTGWPSDEACGRNVTEIVKLVKDGGHEVDRRPGEPRARERRPDPPRGPDRARQPPRPRGPDPGDRRADPRPRGPDRGRGDRVQRREPRAAHEAAAVLPGGARRADRPHQPARVREPAHQRDRVGAREPSRPPRDDLRRPRPVQGRQRHLRPPGGRPAAAPGDRAPADARARERRARAARRRRVRRAARALHAGPGAADRRHDAPVDPRPALPVGHEHDADRRQHRHRPDRPADRERRDAALGRRHRLLFGQGRRPQPRAGLRPGERLGAAPRDALDGAAHERARRGPARHHVPADRARRASREGAAALRAAAAAARRERRDRAAGRVHPGGRALQPDALARPLGDREGAARLRAVDARRRGGGGLHGRDQPVRARRCRTRASSNS